MRALFAAFVCLAVWHIPIAVLATVEPPEGNWDVACPKEGHCYIKREALRDLIRKVGTECQLRNTSF